MEENNLAKTKKKPNAWMITSIVLLVLLLGVSAYAIFASIKLSSNVADEAPTEAENVAVEEEPDKPKPIIEKKELEEEPQESTPSSADSPVVSEPIYAINSFRLGVIPATKWTIKAPSDNLVISHIEYDPKIECWYIGGYTKRGDKVPSFAGSDSIAISLVTREEIMKFYDDEDGDGVDSNGNQLGKYLENFKYLGDGYYLDVAGPGAALGDGTQEELEWELDSVHALEDYFFDPKNYVKL